MYQPRSTKKGVFPQIGAFLMAHIMNNSSNYLKNMRDLRKNKDLKKGGSSVRAVVPRTQTVRC